MSAQRLPTPFVDHRETNCIVLMESLRGGKNESVYFIVASFKSKGRRFGVLENLFLSAFRVCIEIVLFIEVP